MYLLELSPFSFFFILLLNDWSSELDASSTMVQFTVNGAWQASQLPGHFGKPGLTGNLILLCVSIEATNSYHLIGQKIGYAGRPDSQSSCTWMHKRLDCPVSNLRG